MAHRHIIGKDNTGQLELLIEWILTDVKSGAAVCVIDQSGKLTDEIIKRIPPKHIDRTIDFNPAQYAIPFNPFLTDTTAFSTDTMATAIKYGFGFADTPTARMTGLLSNLIYSLIEARQGLFGMYLMLESREYRNHVLKGVSDPVAIRYWQWYNSLPQKAQYEERSSTFNKVQVLMLDPRIRAISGTKSQLDLNDMVKDKILFVRLPQGEFGVEKSTLLANIFLTLIHQACLARDISIPFQLYIKDITRLGVTSLKDILATGADYEMSLTVASNYYAQIDSSLMDSLAANADQYIFRTSKADSEKMQQPSPQDYLLYQLPPFEFVHFHDGTYTREKVHEVSHRTYAQSAKAVHNRMAKKLHSPATKEIDALLRDFS